MVWAMITWIIALTNHTFLFLRRCRRLRFAGVMFPRQVCRIHAYLAGRHIVILRLAHALQIFIKPADDMLQALHPVPRLSGARKLMRFTRKAHHDYRTLQKLERAEHLFTASSRWRAIVGFTQYQHQR